MVILSTQFLAICVGVDYTHEWSYCVAVSIFIESSLGPNLAALRKEQKISGEELAELAGNGLTRSVIANLENGRKKDVTVSQLLALSYALSVSPTTLLFDLRKPYESVEIPVGQEPEVTMPAWFAYGWFGGQYNLFEVVPGIEPALDKPLWIYEKNSSIFHLLRQRDGNLVHEAHLEKLLRDIQTGDLDLQDEENLRRSAWFDRAKGTTENVRRRLTEVRADLYQIDKQLRQLQVELSGRHISPGIPF